MMIEVFKKKWGKDHRDSTKEYRTPKGDNRIDGPANKIKELMKKVHWSKEIQSRHLKIKVWIIFPVKSHNKTIRLNNTWQFSFPVGLCKNSRHFSVTPLTCTCKIKQTATIHQVIYCVSYEQCRKPQPLLMVHWRDFNKEITYRENQQQGGGVGGCALIFSCENSKVTTRCWTTIEGRMMDLTKKR